MVIKKLLFIRQCDIKGCKRIANYAVLYNENDIKTQMCICSQCLEEMTKAYKSVKSKSNKVKNDEKEN